MISFKNKEVGKVAFKIFEHLTNNKNKKIIILDLDNTIWNGVIGENGVDDIKADTSNEGYKFFIFQSFKMLKNNGILLAIVSKNDLDLIEKAFNNNDFILKKKIS